MANVESGWNLVNLLAPTLQVPPEHVLSYAGDLEDQGLLEVYDGAVRLSAEEKSKIDNERAFHQIIKGL